MMVNGPGTFHKAPVRIQMSQDPKPDPDAADVSGGTEQGNFQHVAGSNHEEEEEEEGSLG